MTHLHFYLAIIYLWLKVEWQAKQLRRKEFGKRMVVVIPWTMEDLPTLKRNLSLWKSKYPPCSHSTGLVDLVFWLNRSAEVGQNDLTAMAAPCFRKVNFASANLERDSYPLGASEQFFRLWEQPWLFDGGYSWMFLMEPDCWPCKAGWLDEIYWQASVGFPSGWWMAGSITRPDWNGNTGHAHAEHLNGNALYRLDDEGFLNYLDRVREEFWRQPKRYLQSYDVAIHLVGKMQLKWEEWSAVKHRFIYWNTIQNYYRVAVNATDVCQDPETFMVHGRNVSP